MTYRAHWCLWLGMVLSSSLVCAQTSSPPNQVRWVSWSIASERRSGVDRDTEQSLPVPFRLTPDEKKDIDRVLARWEEWNSNLQTFDCRFKRWTYDVVLGPTGQAKFIDSGVIKYASPDCAMFHVDSTEKDGREIAIEDARAEHWVCDGKSIFEFNAGKKQLIEHRLPAELAGRQLVDGPLAFDFVGGLLPKCLFGGPVWPCPFAATVKQLRKDYYIRKMASPNRDGEVRLEAFPRSRHVASMLSRIELIFAVREMSPVAMKIVQLNGKDYTVYQFFNIVVNDPLSRNRKASFRPFVPSGWQKIVEGLPATQASRPADDGGQSRGQIMQPCGRRFARRHWFSGGRRCLAAGGSWWIRNCDSPKPSASADGYVLQDCCSATQQTINGNGQNAATRTNLPRRIGSSRFFRLP